MIGAIGTGLIGAGARNLGGGSFNFMDPRTNLISSPNAFDVTWSVDNSGAPALSPVITPNNVAAPDGTLTADTLVFDRGAGTFSRISINTTTAIGPDYDFDVWLKAPTAGPSISPRLEATNGPVWSLSTIWQRYRQTITSAGLTMNVQMMLFSSIPGSPSGPVTVHAWGAKLALH